MLRENMFRIVRGELVVGDVISATGISKHDPSREALPVGIFIFRLDILDQQRTSSMFASFSFENR